MAELPKLLYIVVVDDAEKSPSAIRGQCCRPLCSSWDAKLGMHLRIRERKESVTVLLCGTSGCGKSTLSALLIKKELSVSGSDEEADNPPDEDSDGDLCDAGDKQLHEEMEGSVDEESTKSDEEYNDLAIQDVHENDYWLYDDESKDELVLAC